MQLYLGNWRKKERKKEGKEKKREKEGFKTQIARDNLWSK